MDYKNVLLDTDVILDVILKREPFFKNSRMVFHACEKLKLNGFTTPVMLSNLAYMLKPAGTKSQVLEIISSLIEFLEIIGQKKSTVLAALESDFTDFEDALQHFAATENGSIQAIITRNTKDYKHSQIPVFTPKEFLSQIQ